MAHLAPLFLDPRRSRKIPEVCSTAQKNHSPPGQKTKKEKRRKESKKKRKKEEKEKERREKKWVFHYSFQGHALSDRKTSRWTPPPKYFTTSLPLVSWISWEPST